MAVRPTQFGSLPGKSEHTRQYNKFRGVDFSTDPTMIDGSRSPNAINLISDSGGYPEKRGGWEVLQSTNGGPVNGMWYLVLPTGGTRFVAHCGKDLYAWNDIEKTAVATLSDGSMKDAKSTGFVFNDKLYILDGAQYWVYDGTNLKAVENAEPYAPTTVIGRAPTGGGVTLEGVNMLTPWRKNSFVGDGGTKEVVMLQIYNGVPASPSGTTLRIRLGSDATHTVDTTVTVAANDSPTTVAYKIAGATYSGWASTQIGDSVTFEKTAAGKCSTAHFFPDNSGVLAGIVTLTPGKDPTTTLQLDATNLDIGSTVYMSVGGGAETTVTMTAQNRIDGIVPYTGVMPDGHGVDNIVVRFSKTVNGYSDRVKGCTIATWFGQGNDSRCFISGNPNFKNWDWQSGLYDPTYFPDLGYTKVGADTSAIMGYARQFDNLLIVKSDNELDATIYLRTAEYDADGKPMFPLKQGVAGIGAISKYTFANLRDDPLFLAKEGVFAPSLAYGAVNQQRVTQERSFLVNARLTKEKNLQNANAVIWNDLYVLCVNGNCYVADGRQKTGKSSTESFGYEWFFWNNIPARCFLNIGEVLYFGDVNGRVCRFKNVDSNRRYSDGSTRDAGGNIIGGVPIVAQWASKLDDEGDFMRYKEMPLRGSGVMVKPYARSSISIYLRTDASPDDYANGEDIDVFYWGDIDFTRFSFKSINTPSVVAINAKIKRYKTIQVILRSTKINEGFGCYGIVRRFSIGNYVK